jgi:gliding motility-associated-like protein
MKFFLSLFVFTTFIFTGTHAQVFWTETFGTGCNQGQVAGGWTGLNGTWTMTNGTNGAGANNWFVSATEAGMGVNNCGDGCLANAALTNRTLHIGNVATSFCACFFCPTGDCGAAYDACNFNLCGGGSPLTDRRIESPVINCTGQSNITLSFLYMENGQGTQDDATLLYFNGVTWAQIDPLAKTTVCSGGQGRWTAFSILLPASANNNPNVRIGFRWVNDVDGVGTDPSFAVDDITLSTPVAGPPVAAFTASANNICAGSCINFTDNSTGNPTGWTWSFPGGSPATSNVQNPANICFNTAGTYTVTLTAANANGTNSTTQTITVNPIPTVTTAPANPAICQGGSVGLTASGATSYTWSPATGLSSTTVANPNASPTATTTYTVTGTGAGNCSNTATVTVTVNPLPTVTTSPANPAICQGGSTGLTASGATSYSWSPATGLSSTTVANPNASPTATTTYTVTGTGAGNCTNTATVTVTVNPLPTVTSSPANPAICLGGSVGLTASGATTYSWSPGTGLNATTISNPTANPTATTTYTITGTNAGNCSNTATVTVTVNPLPTIAVVPANPSYCQGGSVGLTASGGSSYSWAPATGLSSATVANPTANPTSTTTYTVTGTDGNGCSNTSTVTVTVNALPVISVSPPNPTYCSGGSVTMTASGAANYQWTPATNLSCTTCANPTANPTSTTSYTVSGTDANGCTGTLVVTVTVSPSLNPTVSASPSTICAGDGTQLNAGGGSGYSWAPATGLSCTTCPNPNANPTTTTTYTVTVTGGNCPSVTATVTVNVNPAPTVSVSPSGPTICQGGNVTITASGGTGYSWSPATGLSCTTCPNPTASPAASTSYTVTVSDANGCTATSQVNVNVINCNVPIAAFGASDSAICPNSCVVFSDSSLGNVTTWAWTFQNGTPATSSSQNPGSVCFSSPGNNLVTLIVSNGAGSDTTTMIVNVYNPPTASAGPDVTINIGQSTQLNASGGGSYSWSPGGSLSCTTCPDPVASPTATTTYCVQVTDSNGCRSTDCMTVIVDINCPELFLPTAFSPNGDGMNDFFYPISPCIETMKLLVFDRWGEKVFESTDPTKKWDGTFRGFVLDAAVFVFYFEATLIDGTSFKQKGNVTLVR